MEKKKEKKKNNWQGSLRNASCWAALLGFRAEQRK